MRSHMRCLSALFYICYSVCLCRSVGVCLVYVCVCACAARVCVAFIKLIAFISITDF